MEAKELFFAIVRLLFHNNALWRELKESIVGKEPSVLREYAVPVIALVQLAKFPLIALPRPAMFLGITSFLVDIAALYLIVGGVVSLLRKERSESLKALVLTVICYSMTPVWLGELLYFTGSWSLLFALLALSYSIVISRNGLMVMLNLDKKLFRTALGNIMFFVAIVNSVVFVLINAAIRLFNI